MSFWVSVFTLFLDKFPVSRISESYGHSTFMSWGTFILFAIVTAPVYILTNGAQGFLVQHILLRPSCFPHLASVCGHLFCKAPTQPAPCWIHAFLRCLQTLYPCTKAMVFLDFPWLVWVFSCSSHFLQNWDAIIWSSYSSSSLFWITDASHFLFLSVGGFPWVLDWVCFIYSWESFLFESTAWGCLWDLENHFIFFLESPILQTCLALDVKD